MIKKSLYTCFLYCNHQVHTYFLITLYVFLNATAATVCEVNPNIILNSRFYLTEKHNAFLKIQAVRGVKVSSAIK